MIKIIQKSTDERKKEMETSWKKFQELYYNSNFTVAEIYRKLEISYNSEVHKFINRKLRGESVSPHSRAKSIQYGRWIQ